MMPMFLYIGVSLTLYSPSDDNLFGKGLYFYLVFRRSSLAFTHFFRFFVDKEKVRAITLLHTRLASFMYWFEQQSLNQGDDNTHACIDPFDWVLTVVGSLAAAAHGTALMHGHPDIRDVRFREFKEVEAKVPCLGHEFPIAYQSSISISCLVRNVAMMTSRKDTRYAINLVVTHDGTKFPCWGLHNLMSFKQKFGADTSGM
ncbi:uncharacterized protein LOC131306943 [Rhododendron vialii]|uniref:uncharacterized protein LOC131306943 n=1 Tax=Rhododendron vialii TaxID=182163 RepID=UPI0026601236|nr:uncharacterized protein LOC131306943 [Rhododendron vialii]